MTNLEETPKTYAEITSQSRELLAYVYLHVAILGFFFLPGIYAEATSGVGGWLSIGLATIFLGFNLQRWLVFKDRFRYSLVNQLRRDLSCHETLTLNYFMGSYNLKDASSYLFMRPAYIELLKRVGCESTRMTEVTLTADLSRLRIRTDLVHHRTESVFSDHELMLIEQPEPFYALKSWLRRHMIYPNHHKN